MQYLLTFLEGIVSFISPCMLPMLPVYISYFAGSTGDKEHVPARTISFVLGFTLVFSLLGLFAGTLGALLARYQSAVNLICGAVVILFGLSYLDLLPLSFLKGIQGTHQAAGILSAFTFGMIYSLSLTPCVGAFLGSALMLAATSGGAVQGLLLLLIYSLGLGIPFVLSAVLIEKLTTVFTLIKRHYGVINKGCGIFLIVVGAAMALGWLNRLLALIA